MFLDNIYLAILLPLWIALIIMLGRFFSVYVNKLVIYILTLVSSAYGAILCTGALWNLPVEKILDSSFHFIKINDFIIDFGLHVDKTALIFASVLFLVSFFVQVFSISYMKKEKKTYRFYALLNLFNFAMAGLFFSSNLFQAYFFWEIVGVISYLLIGFEYNKQEKSIASRKVFIINRIGDTALICAVISCAYLMFSYAPNKTLMTLSFTDMNVISTLVYAYASSPLFEIICGLTILAIVIKSAQFPFYTWLQDAMQAKLPVSALLHSATLLASGMFLALRLLPFYTLAPIVLNLFIYIGILTAFVCSISACAQTNPKKALAYSTSAQYGLIFFAVGILNIKAAFALFIAHAFIKALLFITLPKDDDTWNYAKFVIFLISALSLSGILLSGMIAKEMLSTNLGMLGTVIISILSFLTAFYIIRIALFMYDSYDVQKIKPEKLELLAFAGLFVLNILFYIYLHINAEYKIAEPFWASITAWIVVYVLYTKNAFWKVPLLYSLALNGFYLDKFYTKFCVKVYEKFSEFCNKIEKCIFSNYKAYINMAKTGVRVFSFVENKVMNGSVFFVQKTFDKISVLDLKAQSGNIQKYNAYAFIIITLILVFLILGYSAIIIYMGG